MIDDSGKSSLIPHLISILKGNQVQEVKSEVPVIYMQVNSNQELSNTSEINDNAQYINVLSIKTPLYKYDQMCGPIGTRSMTKILKEWEANENVIGVVLDIDCPGGQVSGLAAFADYIYNFSKPIVSFSDGLVASGGLYVLGATDYAIISPFSDFVGSLGTMLSYVDLDGILEKDGAIIKDIYSTDSPRKNEEVRLMKNKNDESLYIKNIINPAANQFISDMNKFRPGMDSEVFQGAIYSPVEAVSKKLVDQLGTIQDAFNKVIELSNSKSSKNSNSKTNTMQTKQLPKLQAVLGLIAPLAITDNGSFLNAEQLDLMESRLAALEESEVTLQTQLQEAQNNTELQTNLTTAQTTITGFETSVDAILTETGVIATGTITEKLTSLSAKVTEMAGKDGANPTNVIVDPKPSADLPKYVDANAEHNQLANQMFK